MNEIEQLIHHNEYWNFNFFMNNTLLEVMGKPQSEDDKELLNFMQFVAYKGCELSEKNSELKGELNELKGTMEILKQKIGELVVKIAEVEAKNSSLKDIADYYKAEQ